MAHAPTYPPAPVGGLDLFAVAGCGGAGHLVQLAEAHRVPVQVHTGLHAGNGNVLGNSRPADLTNLLYRYPRVTFDLFHVGYPFQHPSTASRGVDGWGSHWRC